MKEEKYVYQVKKGHYIKEFDNSDYNNLLISMTTNFDEAKPFNYLSIYKGSDDFTKTHEALKNQIGGKFVTIERVITVK